tara:strand:- start:3377 stop:3793 length:417 start_codon:yes stop_codon:yes gene_type:complete
MKKKAIIVSGYFNPLHKGHIEYFKLAKSRGDLLFIIVNNDIQRKKKGSKEFMLQDERIIIISSLKIVDEVILSIDNKSDVSKTIRYIFDNYKNLDLSFANGGDQNNDIIPERIICEELGIKLIDNLGNKIQSSSWLIK